MFRLLLLCLVVGATIGSVASDDSPTDSPPPLPFYREAPLPVLIRHLAGHETNRSEHCLLLLDRVDSPDVEARALLTRVNRRLGLVHLHMWMLGVVDLTAQQVAAVTQVNPNISVTASSWVYVPRVGSPGVFPTLCVPPPLSFASLVAFVYLL